MGSSWFKEPEQSENGLLFRNDGWSGSEEPSIPLHSALSDCCYEGGAPIVNFSSKKPEKSILPNLLHFLPL